jgi:hypothetical protein
MLSQEKAGYVVGKKQLWRWPTKVEEAKAKKNSQGKKDASSRKKNERTKIFYEIDVIREYVVLLAVENVADREIKIVSVSSTGKSQYPGYSILKGNPNGVGTEFEVKYPEGYIVLGMKRVVRLGNEFREVVYTPYSKELDIPQVRNRGLDYLQDKIQAAQNELRSLRVRSKAFPDELLAEVVPTEVSICLAIIEHIDPSEFARSNSADLINRVLTIIGANRNLAYRYSISGANARGLFQFIPRTYGSVKKLYPRANLIPGFVDGMNNHFNGAKASLLLFDSDISYLKTNHRAFLRNSPEAMGKYLAAAYNGGSPRAAQAIAIEGAGWEKGKILREETRMYLRKFAEVWRLLNN